MTKRTEITHKDLQIGAKRGCYPASIWPPGVRAYEPPT